MKQKSYVYGLKGLQSLLRCSRFTAQKIKNSGKIPVIKTGRKLIFDADAVMAALTTKAQGGCQNGSN